MFRVRLLFLVADTQLNKRLCLSVRQSVRPLVCEHESKSVKTRISTPAQPSATDIGRVSGLVLIIYTTTHVIQPCRSIILFFTKQIALNHLTGFRSRDFGDGGAERHFCPHRFMVEIFI